jgi:hypothetical protein
MFAIDVPDGRQRAKGKGQTANGKRINRVVCLGDRFCFLDVKGFTFGVSRLAFHWSYIYRFT